MAKRKVEVFSASCPACEEVIAMVNDCACGSCDVRILDMNDDAVSARARSMGVRTVPAVAVDGELLACCQRGPEEEDLRAAGIGEPLE